MASDAYIQAAKLANRQPTTYMSVESAEGQTLYYTTQSQWDGSDVLTDINTTEEVGSAIHGFSEEVGGLPVSTPWKFVDGDGIPVANGASVATSVDARQLYFNKYITNIAWPFGLPAEAPMRVLVRDLVEFPTIEFISPTVTQTGLFAGLTFLQTPFDLRGADILNTSDTRYLIIQAFVSGAWFNVPLFALGGPIPWGRTVYLTSQLITSAIDFGAVTSFNPIFSADDITDAGALIAYSYTYSTDDITYLSGGTIVDGSSLVASRYFKIQADFSTTTGGRGKIREFQLKEGIFRYFGSHIDTPFAGVSPQIIKDSVSTLSQKIQIGRGLSTTGESSVRMFWVPEVSDMIASGYLKGKDVAIYSGFVGLPTDAYEPILVGTWYDHDLDEINRVITVTIRDAFKQFEKRKIPEEVVNTSTGAITTTPLTYTTTSLVTVMKDIFDNIGLRDRYISEDFDTLEVGDYAAEKYKVSRVISKSLDFNKLLDELAVTGSMYLVPQGNGQIKPKPFDPNQEHTATLDATEIDFVNLKGNISEFFSRFYAYYNPDPLLFQVTPKFADPSDDTDDYDNGTAVIDATAEVNWFPERGTKQHFDKWLVGRTTAGTPLTTPPTALADLMGLWNSLFTEPLYTVSAKKIPPRFANIEPADVIEVDNLDLPVVDNAWSGGLTDSGKFKDVSAEDGSPSAFYIKAGGAKMYVVGSDNDAVFQYSLLTSWDISTASYDSVSLPIVAQDSSVTSIYFRSDGEKMFLMGAANATVYQYTLTTAWDISTASYDTISKDVSTEETIPTCLAFNATGTSMYGAGVVNDTITQYTLTTPWDISTASLSGKTKSVVTEDSAIRGLTFNSRGDRVYIIGQSNTIFQYSLSSAWDISTASYDSVSKAISSPVRNSILLKDDGLSFFFVDAVNDEVNEFVMPEPESLVAESYTEGDRVIHDGFMWRARQDNTDKDPTSEAAFWQNTLISEAGLTVGKHFFVLGRKFNPNQATMELDLMEMPPGTLGAFSADEFSSDFDIG